MSWRRLPSYIAYVVALAILLLVLGWFILGFMEFASRPLVPTGVSADVDLVVRSMQTAFQFSAFLFTAISLVVALLGFIGFKSLMERTQESLQQRLMNQIDKVFDKAASTHTWRAEAHLSGRLGWLLWRMGRSTNDPSLLDMAIVDTAKGLRKLEQIEVPTKKDLAGLAILKSNLAYFHAERFRIKGSDGDKMKALELAADILDSYHRYFGREAELEIPYGVEEFAETRMMVLQSCDGSAKAKLQIERICEMLENDLGGKPEKADWLSTVIKRYKAS